MHDQDGLHGAGALSSPARSRYRTPSPSGALITPDPSPQRGGEIDVELMQDDEVCSEFNEIIAKGGGKKLPKADPTRTEVFFDDAGLDAIILRLSPEQYDVRRNGSLRLAMFDMSDNSMISALMELSTRLPQDKHIFILFDATQFKDIQLNRPRTFQSLELLRAQKRIHMKLCSGRYSGIAGRMHLKACCTQEWCSHGSTNLTYAARAKNLEGLMITTDRGVVRLTLERFNLLWKAATTYEMQSGVEGLISLIPDPSEWESLANSIAALTETTSTTIGDDHKDFELRARDRGGVVAGVAGERKSASPGLSAEGTAITAFGGRYCDHGGASGRSSRAFRRGRSEDS